MRVLQYFRGVAHRARIGPMQGTLYLVATPIGNLADITYRAIEILREVHLIACEDTRHTQKLLQHYGIKTKTLSYHEHNEKQRAKELVDKLNDGFDVAIVSDAGTPAISDPGFRVVQLAIAANVRVVPVPGPSALIAALTASGLSTNEFFFAGFLPSGAGARREKIRELSSLRVTLVLYEAPHRLPFLLQDALEFFDNRQAVVARELTKLHEEIRRGSLSELVKLFSSEEKARGEFVVLIDGQPVANVVSSSESVGDLVDRLESEGLDRRSALKKAAREMGLSRAEAYRRLVVERGGD